MQQSTMRHRAFIAIKKGRENLNQYYSPQVKLYKIFIIFSKLPYFYFYQEIRVTQTHPSATSIKIQSQQKK